MNTNMTKITTASLFFLAAGILTSVSILSAYQILFTIPALWYTYLAFKEKQIKLPKSSWFLIAFVVIAFISLVINLDLVPKPSKNFGRIKYYLFGVTGIFVFRHWLKDASDKTKKFLVCLFLVSIIISGLYAAYEVFFIGKERAKTLTDTMRYGYGSGMLLLTLLSAILHREKISRWFDARLGLIAFIVGFVGMYLTYTRGGLLGFLCGLPFVIYFYRPKLGIGIGVLALLGVLGLGGIYLFSTKKYENRFLANKSVNSDVLRRSQWDAAIIAIKEKPILGWGLSNFHTQVKRIKIENDLQKKNYDDAHAHNLFLEVAAGTGLIGLTIFVGWLFMWAWEGFTGGTLTRALVVPFGVALVISSQFEVILDANNASMIFFLYGVSSATDIYCND